MDGYLVRKLPRRGNSKFKSQKRSVVWLKWVEQESRNKRSRTRTRE